MHTLLTTWNKLNELFECKEHVIYLRILHVIDARSINVYLFNSFTVCEVNDRNHEMRGLVFD